MTVVCDLENATVEHVAEDRCSESLEAFWQSLSPEQLTAIKAIAMDMWTPYIQATIKCVPDAGGKIVFDRFHIMNHMVKAVDKVRRQEHRRLSAAGDDASKGTKYLWLYSEENLPDNQASPNLGDPQRAESQGGPGLGHQREPALLVGLFPRGLDQAVL